MQSTKEIRRRKLKQRSTQRKGLAFPNEKRVGNCNAKLWPNYTSRSAAIGHTRDSNEIIQLIIIAEQNDLFRRSWPHALIPGRFLLMPGVAARPGSFQSTCISAVRSYNGFPDANEPYDTRRMSALEVDGERIWFRIDLYDEHYRSYPKNPINPSKTKRLLRVYSADDWECSFGKSGWLQVGRP